jgi:tetratricopeptide (TPR) repeat protein
MQLQRHRGTEAQFDVRISLASWPLCSLCLCGLILFNFAKAATTQPIPAYWNTTQRAEDLAFHGKYSAALAMAGHATDDSAMAVRAECLAATGQTDAAIALLGDKANEQIELAKILLAAYRPAEARISVRDYLKDYPTSIEAHYLLGLASERLGDLDAARNAYAWFADQKFLDQWQVNSEGPVFASAADVVAIGRSLDRLAILDGLYTKEPSLHERILDLFVRSYDVIDREYWPAHLAAAEYFLAHNQEKEAGEELAAALAGNPVDEESLGLVGKMALDNFDFDAVDQTIAKIRSVDSESIVADLLEARSLLRQRRDKDAEMSLHRVLHKTPENIEALGLLASAAALQLQDAHTTQILESIAHIAPQDATAYEELGDQLAEMRQYPQSEAMYKIAIERAPWWSEPHNALGLLYTQSGDEQNARITLAAAHAMDPFNLKTANYLQLLDDLDHFAKKESAHFVVSYDAKTDSILADYLPAYLESIYPVICKTFAHEPAVKTFIEVFPTHAEFSVRTTGLPWIGTVGASTGRVLALVAPRDGEATLGTFNWAEVLRHEFTHTVTLSATDNRISHWMTEGLATLEEGTPLRWEWVPMVYQAVQQRKLFTIQQLTWAFIRPKRPVDRQLAYAESYWICQHIRDTQGWGAILKMMDSYRRGENETQVFHDALGISDVEFFKQFSAWAAQQIATWGYDPASDEKYDSLREQAQRWIEEKNYAPAVDIWKQIAKLRPMEELPHKRLAGLYLQLGQKRNAITQLQLLDNLSLKDNVYAKAIARLYRDLNDPEHERQFAMRAVWINPYDVHGHELLAEALDWLGDPTAADERKVISILDNRRSTTADPGTR